MGLNAFKRLSPEIKLAREKERFLRGFFPGKNFLDRSYILPDKKIIPGHDRLDRFFRSIKFFLFFRK